MIKTTLISQWITSLLVHSDLPFTLFYMPDFLEDGMNLEEYWNYEKNHFDSLASLYDLDIDFKVEILSEYTLSPNKTMVFFYLYNKYGKIVYKMHQSFLCKDNEYYICGNNFSCQLVPKFIIQDHVIVGLGLAIESSFDIEKIFSPNLSLDSFNKGANYNEDHFFNAQFFLDSENSLLENSWYDFYLYVRINNKLTLEKRKIYFDIFDINLFPLIIKNSQIIIINDKYPVNLAIFNNNILVQNYPYPRDITLSVEKYDKLVVTDCLDNDWYINLGNI